jgi:hypothetical protein
MLKRFFVTGTDTSVGKTVVSRALLQALAYAVSASQGTNRSQKAVKRRQKDCVIKTHWFCKAFHPWNCLIMRSTLLR